MNGTFKKKRKAPGQFYGYDPSIQVIPGDPRLNPPPSWFRVNFHPSQPVNNAWQDWAGDDLRLFDISQNKALPLSAESDIRRDASSRPRQKLMKTSDKKGNSQMTVPIPKELMTMVLHPAQPVDNAWFDWEEVGPLSTQRSKDVKNDQCECCESSTSVSGTLRNKADSNFKSIESLLLSSSNHISSAPASNGGNLNRDRRAISQPTSEYKARKKVEADLRNKQVQLILRIRKQLYVESLKERVAHLEENTQTMSGSKKGDPQLIEAILLGDSTFDVPTHKFCGHNKVDTWKIISAKLNGTKTGLHHLSKTADNPEYWKKRINEAISQVDTLRLRFLLGRDKEVKRDAAELEFRALLTDIRAMHTCISLYRNFIETILQLQSKQWMNGSNELHSVVNEIVSNNEQIESIGMLYNRNKESIYETQLQLRILDRMLVTIWNLYLKKRIEDDGRKLQEVLSSKQLEKVLLRAAKWRTSLGDRVDDVLKTMAALSLRQSL